MMYLTYAFQAISYERLEWSKFDKKDVMWIGDVPDDWEIPEKLKNTKEETDIDEWSDIK
jgi:hypothetical protein